MRVTFCKFCDYAAVVDGNKGAVLGMFDTIGSATFPFRQALFHLCVEVEFENDEFGQSIPVSFELMNEDGQDLFRIDARMNVPIGRVGKPIRLLQNFRLDGMVFAEPGIYRLDVKSGGVTLSEERLFVEQTPPEATERPQLHIE